MRRATPARSRRGCAYAGPRPARGPPGTFLYVAAVHILPEVQHAEGHGTPMSLPSLLALSLGIAAPLLVTVDHAH